MISPGGHRLGLRRPQPKDAEQFLELYGTVPVHRIGHAAHALAEERTRIERHLADPHEKHGFGLFVVVDEITQEIVGRTGIKHSLAPEVGDWEIDYMLRRDHRGHGIGRCVAGWTMKQVRQRWSIARVLAHVARDNTPSIRILEAEGFLPMGECEFEDYPEMGVLLRYVWEQGAQAMLRPTPELHEFERRYARRRDAEATYEEALGVFKSLWAEACTLRSDFRSTDWRRDIEPDLAIARAINGLPPA